MAHPSRRNFSRGDTSDLPALAGEGAQGSPRRTVHRYGHRYGHHYGVSFWTKVARPSEAGRILVAAVSCAVACIIPLALAAQDPPEIEIAEDLFVDLDSRHESAGSEVWESQGGLTQFAETGDPVVEDHDGAPGVDLNISGLNPIDAYVCVEDTPAGLTGVDATRSIEVWVYNPDNASEETLVSWGQRGGPNGTNVSFNMGTHVLFSAIGHWGGEFPDIGWGPIPPPAVWHHLVYTYDGTTTRVYQDGHASNVEYLGPGVINTFPNPKIAVGAQWDAGGVALNVGLRGTLSIGKLRIHDGTLSDGQILRNYFIERSLYPLPAEEEPGLLNQPSATAPEYVMAGAGEYSFQLKVGGFPLPTFAILEPAGATVSDEGRIAYAVPQPEPASFNVKVRLTNSLNTLEAAWTVTVLKGTDVQAAGELLVSLDAADPSAGTDTWVNQGSMGDFAKVGEPAVVTIDGGKGLSFNEGATSDAYTSVNDAPEGIMGPDPTRSIEAWVFNASAGMDEALVSWGMRGGPDGSNISLNFGTHQWYGAVTHWGGSHGDLGWTPSVPPVGQWNHLVYTFDGATTRVYSNGELAAWEGLGPGQINTHPGKVTIAAGNVLDAVGGSTMPDLGATRGSLIVGRVRVHDEVLHPAQILNNYRLDRKSFPLPPAPSFTATPETGIDPVEITFDGNASTSPNGNIVKFSWDFGDGQTAEGAVRKHTYPAAHRYLPALTVLDDKGADASLQKPVTVQFRTESLAPWILGEVSKDPPLLKGGARPEGAGCLRVYSGGKDIAGSEDQFTLVHQALGSPASIEAQVSSEDVLDRGRIGLMFREDFTHGSRHAAILFVNSSKKVAFTRREASNAFTKPAKNSTESFAVPNVWLRLERQGNDFIGSTSPDGTTWTELSRATLANAPASMRAGIAVSAGDTQGAYLDLTGVLCNVKVTGGAELPAAPAGLVAAPGDGQVALNWNDNGEPDLAGYRVYRSPAAGGPYAKVGDPAASAFTDTGLTNGTAYYYVVRAVGAGGESANSTEVSATPSAGGGLRRGDANVDGTLDLTDPVSVLNYQFLAGPIPACLDAADADDSGSLDLTDAVYSLNYQFLAGPRPPAPGPDTCGPDPTDDPAGDLGCATACI